MHSANISFIRTPFVDLLKSPYNHRLRDEWRQRSYTVTFAIPKFLHLIKFPGKPKFSLLLFLFSNRANPEKPLFPTTKILCSETVRAEVVKFRNSFVSTARRLSTSMPSDLQIFRFILWINFVVAWWLWNSIG